MGISLVEWAEKNNFTKLWQDISICIEATTSIPTEDIESTTRCIMTFIRQAIDERFSDLMTEKLASLVDNITANSKTVAGKTQQELDYESQLIAKQIEIDKMIFESYRRNKS